MHATALCPRHVDPSLSACLCRLCCNLCCADKGPRQGVYAHAHPYTPNRKGTRAAGGLLLDTGPGTGSGEEFGKKWATIFQGIGAVLGVAGATAVVVRTFDQSEIKRIEAKGAAEIKHIESKAAAEIAQAKADVARVEDKRTMSELFWKAEVERFKREVQLAYTQDYMPYQTAISEQKKKKKRGGAGGLEKEEEKD